MQAFILCRDIEVQQEGEVAEHFSSIKVEVVLAVTHLAFWYFCITPWILNVLFTGAKKSQRGVRGSGSNSKECPVADSSLLPHVSCIHQR